MTHTANPITEEAPNKRCGGEYARHDERQRRVSHNVICEIALATASPGSGIVRGTVGKRVRSRKAKNISHASDPISFFL